MVDPSRLSLVCLSLLWLMHNAAAEAEAPPETARDNTTARHTHAQSQAERETTRATKPKPSQQAI